MKLTIRNSQKKYAEQIVDCDKLTEGVYLAGCTWSPRSSGFANSNLVISASVNEDPGILHWHYHWTDGSFHGPNVLYRELDRWALRSIKNCLGESDILIYATFCLDKPAFFVGLIDKQFVLLNRMGKMPGKGFMPSGHSGIALTTLMRRWRRNSALSAKL